MKLALGTAQFGLNYGISNSLGQVALCEVEKILKYAKSIGIRTLDTANAYGESELTLGKISISQDFDIISKIPALKSNDIDIAPYFSCSLNRLNSKNIDALMFHDADDLLKSSKGQLRFRSLLQQKELEKVNKIGLSVYNPEQVERVITRYPIDIIQLPLNCLDQRFINSGVLKTTVENKIEVHCRSIFLQGLLLMEDQKVDDYFTPYLSFLEQFWRAAKEANLSPLAFALSIAVQRTEINKIIVGCCSVKQLEQIVKAYESAQNFAGRHLSLACNDENFIIPSNWQTGN